MPKWRRADLLRRTPAGIFPEKALSRQRAADGLLLAQVRLLRQSKTLGGSRDSKRRRSGARLLQFPVSPRLFSRSALFPMSSILSRPCLPTGGIPAAPIPAAPRGAISSGFRPRFRASWKASVAAFSSPSFHHAWDRWKNRSASGAGVAWSKSANAFCGCPIARRTSPRESMSAGSGPASSIACWTSWSRYSPVLSSAGRTTRPGCFRATWFESCPAEGPPGRSSPRPRTALA